MKSTSVKQRRDLSVDIDRITSLIRNIQTPQGEIPWYAGGKTDPWDHVESAMGLSVGGCESEARHAFQWLKENQLADGSWYAEFRDGIPADRTRDANFSAYVAVGVFHHFLVTGDTSFMEDMWETVESAIDFALSLQAAGGEIHWAIGPEGNPDPMALLTGSSSVYMSIKCALAIAHHLGREKNHWITGLNRLGEAIRHKPYLFNMTKSRFSMDWFYPVLCGAVSGLEAQKRIDKHWKKFVVKGMGIRCVSDQPWVTIAESSELVIALAAMGNRSLSEIIFGWILDHTFGDSSFWCGFTFPDMTIWPEEKIAWTNAVVLMAADTLYHLTPAGRMFNHGFWQDYPFLK